MMAAGCNDAYWEKMKEVKTMCSHELERIEGNLRRGELSIRDTSLLLAEVKRRGLELEHLKKEVGIMRQQNRD